MNPIGHMTNNFSRCLNLLERQLDAVLLLVRKVARAALESRNRSVPSDPAVIQIRRPGHGSFDRSVTCRTGGGSAIQFNAGKAVSVPRRT